MLPCMDSRLEPNLGIPSDHRPIRTGPQSKLPRHSGHHAAGDGLILPIVGRSPSLQDKSTGQSYPHGSIPKSNSKSTSIDRDGGSGARRTHLDLLEAHRGTPPTPLSLSFSTVGEIQKTRLGSVVQSGSFAFRLVFRVRRP